MADEAKRRIMIVEDDPEINLLLRKVLERGYEVLQAKDGREALNTLNRIPPPDLVIADIMMPNLDGLSMVKAMKNHPVMKRIPVIFLTAKSGSMDVISGISAGAKHYITKPFKIDEVLSKVKKVLGAA